MGDHWAPAIAPVAHEQLLYASGALAPEERLKLGFPLPRSPGGHYSGVCIDDKLSLQIFSKYVPPDRMDVMPSARDLKACI